MHLTPVTIIHWHRCIASFISYLLHSSHPCYQLWSWFCLQLCLLSVILSSSLDGFCGLLGTPGEELVQWSRMCLSDLKPVLGKALEFPHLLLKISKRGDLSEVWVLGEYPAIQEKTPESQEEKMKRATAHISFASGKRGQYRERTALW